MRLGVVRADGQVRGLIAERSQVLDMMGEQERELFELRRELARREMD